MKGNAYTDTSAVNGTTYYYVVSAANSLGESDDSNEASATPHAPADLKITSMQTPPPAGAGIVLHDHRHDAESRRWRV